MSLPNSIIWRTTRVDKELALRNVIANQAPEGLVMTPDEIERSPAILEGDLSIDDAVAEIYRELQASNRSTTKSAHG